MTLQKMHNYRDSQGYVDWVQAHDTLTDRDRALIRGHISVLSAKPLFSIVLIPVGNEAIAIGPVVASLLAQLYPYWEAWVPAEAQIADSRLKTLPIPVNAPDWLAVALAASTGRFVMPIPSDAVLSERALYELAAAASDHPRTQIFFTDEDQLDQVGRRCLPLLKTAWDPDLMLGRDAIGLLAAYDRERLAQLSAFDELSPSVELYDLALRATASALPDQITHIPAILCHRRSAPDVPPAWNAQAARDVVRRHLAVCGDLAVVEAAPLAPQWNRIIRPVPSPAPLVSILLPTRDQTELLARSTDAVLTRTDYPNMELLVVDNDSQTPDALALLRQLSMDPRVRILTVPGPFNYSAMNNHAARQARGEILVLLNNDTDVVHPGWLTELVSQACRDEVGVVGAKLLYEDGRVQHAGVVFDANGEVIHQLRLADGDDPGPAGELALTRTVSAVTGACLCVRRAVYFEIGGLDERNLAVSYNDIDLCLRAGDYGYRVVFTSFADLLHLESASRGPTDASAATSENLAREKRWFQATWQGVLAQDPFHNPNLAFAWTGTELSSPPRRRQSWLK